jgi:hypothetical protein
VNRPPWPKVVKTTLTGEIVPPLSTARIWLAALMVANGPA